MSLLSIGQIYQYKHLERIHTLSKMAVAVEPVANARVVAGLMYKNQWISFGICQKKSHPFQAKYSKNKDSIYLHAETDCIKNAVKNSNFTCFNKSILYVCRVKYEVSNGKHLIFGLSKPCDGCLKAILAFDIKSVIYSLDNIGYEHEEIYKERNR